MYRKKIKPAFSYQRGMEVKRHYSGDVYIEIDNSPLPAVTQIGKEGAHDLIRFLTESFGAPEPVTFQSQFAELAVGDQFKATRKDGYTLNNCVKIDDTRYFNYTTGMIKVASWVASHLRIIKN